MYWKPLPLSTSVQEMATSEELNKQLYVAVARDDTERATQLLEIGADVNTRDDLERESV